MDNFAAIQHMVRHAEENAEDMSAARIRAAEYYDGKMTDTPSDEGRSEFVSRDLRAHIKKVLPSITRVIFGSDQVVEYQPVEQGDEDSAQQASDYMNLVVIPETDARRHIEDAIHDALLLRNGILKWWHVEKQSVKFSHHSGLTEDELAQLVGDEDEIVERSERQEEIPAMMQGPDGEPMEIMQPVTVYDVKLRRSETQRKQCVSAVPRERFLIDQEATTIEDADLVGEKTEISRSDLVAMGYDKDMVWKLNAAIDDDADEEADIRRGIYDDDDDEVHKANQKLDYYDLYVRIDMDGDGVAELHHMQFAGGLKEDNLLEDNEVDEIQFCDVCAMPRPHQWEGFSLADDLMDIQRIKTVLMRQTLDNLYWQNSPTPYFQNKAVEDEEALYNPEFGKPIRGKEGYSAKDAVSFIQVPFVADKSFGMIEYMDSEAQDRTGISDAASGMAPDALQNTTAKASAMIEAQGIGQVEYLVRNIAESLKPLFRGLLRLVIRHQDKPRTVRLRDEWVQFDPRDWNADMDMSVNTGLGAGTRERDMMMMQQVIMLQERIAAMLGPDNPFVKPDNLYNALSKMVEAAGLKTPALYFTEPDPQQIAAQMEEQRNKPSETELKLQAQMQMEQMKQQTQAAKEKAQMDADLTVKRAEIQAESQRQADELASKAALAQQEIAWEREKFAAELAFKREQAAQQRQDEILKAQAAAFQPQEAANG